MCWCTCRYVSAACLRVTYVTGLCSKSGYSGGVNMWKPPSRAGSISSLSSIPPLVSELYHLHVNLPFSIIIIISYRRQRSVASTQSRCVHDGEPSSTRHECQKVCSRRFVESTSSVGDLYAGANREGRSQFVLPRPVTTHDGLAMAKQWVLPPGDDFLDTGQVGSVKRLPYF